MSYYHEPSIRLRDILELYAGEHTERVRLESELSSLQDRFSYHATDLRCMTKERDELRSELEALKDPMGGSTPDARTTVATKDDGA